MSGTIEIDLWPGRLTVPATLAGYLLAALFIAALSLTYITAGKRRQNQPSAPATPTPVEPGSSDGTVLSEPGGQGAPTPVEARSPLLERRGQRSRPQPNRRHRAQQRQNRRERRRPPARR